LLRPAARGHVNRLPARFWSLTFSADGKRLSVGLEGGAALIYPVSRKVGAGR
jgi:hypothetical protein